MTARKRPQGAPLAASIRAAALDPWRNLRSEVVPVPEWGNAKVLLRGMTAAEWLEYGRRAQAMTPAADDAEAEQPAAARATPHDLYAFVLVCAVHEQDRTPVFTVEDVPEVAKVFTDVHDRLASKVFELSGVPSAPAEGEPAPDPVAAAGNA